MITFPNCKINIGLHVVEKRSDGYHNLETVFYPLLFTDILEIVENKASLKNSPKKDLSASFSATGLSIAGDPGNNLCLKAWQLLKQEHKDLPSVFIHLHKTIPMGAGLGGGSSDGAFTLTLLNEKFDLNLSKDALASYALRLGSDCPFFIYNQPAFASGRGEIMKPLDLDLSHYSFLVINPGLHISTAQAFSRIVPTPAPIQLADSVMLPVAHWKDRIRNDFEESAFFYYPELKQIKTWLYDAGALYASMTGSGSCFYGIFLKDKLPKPDSDEDWDMYRIP